MKYSHCPALLSLVIAPTFVSTATAQFILDWRQPAFGQFNASSSWTPDLAPTNPPLLPNEEFESVRFGTSLTTVNTEIGVLFIQNEQVIDAEVFSGSYEFRYGNPGLSFAAGRLVVGNEEVPGLLPASASLTLRVPDNFTFPGSVVVERLEVGDSLAGAISQPSDLVPHEGTLTLEGKGVEVAVVNNALTNPSGTGRTEIGEVGNTGIVRVLGGASLDSALDITLGGGGALRKISDPAIEVGRGTLVVDGQDNNPFLDQRVSSLVTTDFLEIGNVDFDRDVPMGFSDRVVGVGSVQLDDGGHVIADTVLLGNSELPNSRVGLGLPSDEIVGRSGTVLAPERTSRISVGNTLVLGAESVFDVEIDSNNNQDGGVAIIGSVDSAAIMDLETVYLGPTGRIEGTGLIRGDVNQLGGVIRPGHSAGSLVIEGNLLASAGIFEFEVFGAATSNNYDQVIVVGDASLTGMLSVDFGSFVPTPGQSFTLFDVGGELQVNELDVRYFNASSELTSLLRFENGILSVIPEPSTTALLSLSVVSLAARCRTQA